MPLDKDISKRKIKLDCELERVVSRIKDLGVQKIILFGSLAKGQISFSSDIDLIVIKETDKRFIKRLKEVYSHVKPKTAVDILVYTPQEYRYLLMENEFIKDISKKGTVIYEQKGERSS